MIRLEIYDLHFQLIENKISWSFDLIQQKIQQKIQNLAIIKVDVMNQNNQQFFHYYNIHFYELKDFDCFIKLIKIGVIKLTFDISVYLTGPKYGEMHNHGIGFVINEYDIEKMYKKNN